MNPMLYLDHAATTPMDPRVGAAMARFWTEDFGNPSSLHGPGRVARQAVEQARQTLSHCLGGEPPGWIFTSGGTEANNLVILGLAQSVQAQGKHLITTAIEHPAVLNPFQHLAAQGWDVTHLSVDDEGRVSPSTLLAALRRDTVLVSIMHGNNEIGTVQDLNALGGLLRERGVLFHTDAVQTAGKLPLDLSTLPVDYLSLSGHKLYGPKGIGALYCRPDAPKPVPLLLGGGQEAGLRSGTENVAAIVGLAEALHLCIEGQAEEAQRLRGLQERLIAGILDACPTAVLNGPRDVAHRVPGSVNFSFPPLEGESLVIKLDMRGVAVSSGSACHSAVIEPSHVILALGKPVEVARSTVRFSLGRGTTEADVDRVVGLLPKVVAAGSKASPARPPAFRAIL